MPFKRRPIPTPSAAIREGRVEVQTRPLSVMEAAAHITDLMVSDWTKSMFASAPAQHPLGKNL